MPSYAFHGISSQNKVLLYTNGCNSRTHWFCWVWGGRLYNHSPPQSKGTVTFDKKKTFWKTYHLPKSGTFWRIKLLKFDEWIPTSSHIWKEITCSIPFSKLTCSLSILVFRVLIYLLEKLHYYPFLLGFSKKTSLANHLPSSFPSPRYWSGLFRQRGPRRKNREPKTNGRRKRFWSRNLWTKPSRIFLDETASYKLDRGLKIMSSLPRWKQRSRSKAENGEPGVWIFKYAFILAYV